MSYVSEKKRGNPVGMGAAVLVNGSIILAVALSPLVVERVKPKPPIFGEPIELTPPKPKEVIEQESRKMPPIFVPKPINDTGVPPVDQVATSEKIEDTGPLMDGQGGDDETEIVRDIINPPASPFKAATRDLRFTRNFQPDYPVRMLQREIEGIVTIRVLIGTDGRVRQAQILSATEPDFARATERQALKAWRFKPATRGGEPVEDWQTLTVRFDIN
ncbi:MAG: TonB family protein [Sphingorhabdus sp.]